MYIYMCVCVVRPNIIIDNLILKDACRGQSPHQIAPSIVNIPQSRATAQLTRINTPGFSTLLKIVRTRTFKDIPS